MSAAAPARFGAYVILDRIGDGGMAEIFLAKMTGYSGFEKLVALKRILPRYSENTAFARMLIHEAKLAARLQHFNVVQVLDLGEIQGQVFIAMEYVRGRDLAALLSTAYRRKERLPVAISLFVAAEFLTGLDYAHRLTSDDGTPLGLIHRDISPQNVLISYEGEVKLTDFGIARVIEQDNELLLPGNLHGKFGYMSPEQVEGQSLDQRSDIFGAGVVLHEMLTGQRLFRGKGPRETIELVRNHEIPLPSTVNPEVPAAVDRIVAKALARNREERYQTIGSFLGDISRVADTLNTRAGRRDLAVYMRRQFGSTAGRTSNSPSKDKGRGVSRVSGFSPTAGTRVPLGEILVSRGSVRLDQLEIALAEQRARGGRLGEILVETGIISEEILARALALQANLRMISEQELADTAPTPVLLSRFPRRSAEDRLILPLSFDLANNTVTLAIADPFDQRAVLEAKVVLGAAEVNPLVASRRGIREAIERWYPKDPEISETPLPVIELLEPEEIDISSSAPVVPVVVIGEPDPVAAAALAERLKDEEYEVWSAQDGKTARGYCRDKAPLVVVLDVALPGIDGYNVLLDLRSRGSEAAVFMTSSRQDNFQQAKALELGADDFIAKPLNVEVFTSKIRREVQKRTGGRRAMAAPVQFAGVSGSLTDMNALDIVQSLELGRKTAHVVIQYEDGRSGELGVVLGELKGCSAQDQLGESAFYLLARAGAGVFRIEYRTPTVPQNIERPNTFLILEALRRIDESARGPDDPPPNPSLDPAALIDDLHEAFSSRPPPARSSAPAPKLPSIPPDLAALARVTAPSPPWSAERAATLAPAETAVSPHPAPWVRDLPPVIAVPELTSLPWSPSSPSPLPSIPPGLAGPWHISTPPPPAPVAPAPHYLGPPPAMDTPTKQRLAKVALQRVATTAAKGPPPPRDDKQVPVALDSGDVPILPPE